MNVSGDYNPYFVLKQIYDNLGDYDKFLDILKRLKEILPNDPSVDRMIDDYTKLANRNKLEVPEQNK
jgi:ASC-1-like (ASCH) protein